MTRQRAPRRRWNVKPWPWKGDTAEDRAKRIALSYRQLVFDISQGRCFDPAGDLHRLDAQWAEYGQFWPCPGLVPVDEHDDWYTAADLAHLLSKAPTDIYRWARQGKIQQRTSAEGWPEYSLTSAKAYMQKRRTSNTRTA